MAVGLLWLIARFIDPQAEFLLAPLNPGMALPPGANVILREVAEVISRKEGVACRFEAHNGRHGSTSKGTDKASLKLPAKCSGA